MLHGLHRFQLHHNIGRAVHIPSGGQLRNAVAIVPQAGGAAAPAANGRILAVLLQAADVIHGTDLGNQQGVRTGIQGAGYILI